MGICERKQRIFYRKTKKGNIIKVVREHYLRDDVWCGLQKCQVCLADKTPLEIIQKTEKCIVSFPHHILIDTNVAVHQIDLLCQEAIKNVIVLQTVLQEVRHRSLHIYKILRDLIDDTSKHFYVFNNEHHSDCYIDRNIDETANDRNDRAICIAGWWYKQHFALSNQNIVLLTNDIKNRDRARELELEAFTVQEYVTSLENYPDLLDHVAQMEEFDENIEGAGHQRFSYDMYLSLAEIKSGIKSGKLLQGILKTSRNNFLEANVMVEGTSEKCILIQGRNNLNRALHDDLVAIQLLPKSQWSAPSTVVIDQQKEEEEKDGTEEEDDESVAKEQHLLDEGASVVAEKQPTGKVVGIIRRKWRQYCGILKKNEIAESFRHIFVPSEKRIPFIRIETRQGAALYDNRILVAIDSWPRDSKNPKGHFVRVIGKIGETETENEVILLEHDCPHSKFSESVLKCLPKLPWTITPKDEAERVDLRHLNICSVDPVGCTDIDDALHCVQLPNGNFEVGVHIADVSHFIRPNTAIDQEAQNRSTSVYLTTKRIDMVPDLLSSNLCSLRGNVDRFAFSVMWEVTKDCEIIPSKTRFAKTIIKSRGELTYEMAQMRIEDDSMQDDLTISLRALNKLAKKLKKKRLNAGALVLASMEVKFHIDPDTDTVVDIVAKQHLETMSMVEEFMLLANVTAAEMILKNFPDCALLRRHPAPPPSNFEPLLLAAKSQGIILDVTDNKSLAASLERESKVSGRNIFFNNMLRIMTTRCMMQALYFCSGTLEKAEFVHYGLATECYTHFTSPIRRFADIIVHRLLAAAIEKDRTYPELLDPKKCAELSQHINYRHKMAQYAGRGSSVVAAVSSMRGKVSEYDAYILFLHKNAIQVLVPTIGQELTLYLDSHVKDYERKEKERKRAKGRGLAMDVDDQPDIKKEDLPEFLFYEKELYIECKEAVSRPDDEVVRLRPFDDVIIQVSVDSSDVQHEKVVTRLVKPYIKGYSVPSIKLEELRPKANKLKFKKLKTT